MAKPYEITLNDVAKSIKTLINKRVTLNGDNCKNVVICHAKRV